VLGDHGKSVDCRVPNKQRWTEKGQSHQVPNSGKKEKKKRRKEKGMQLRSLCMITVSIIHVMNEGTNINWWYISLTFVSLLARMLAIFIQQ